MSGVCRTYELLTVCPALRHGVGGSSAPGLRVLRRPLRIAEGESDGQPPARRATAERAQEIPQSARNDRGSNRRPERPCRCRGAEACRGRYPRGGHEGPRREGKRLSRPRDSKLRLLDMLRLLWVLRFTLYAIWRVLPPLHGSNGRQRHRRYFFWWLLLLGWKQQFHPYLTLCTADCGRDRYRRSRGDDAADYASLLRLFSSAREPSSWLTSESSGSPSRTTSSCR
jgi:hypothetical protein